MYSGNGHVDSMVDENHIEHQLPCCFCFIMDKRHFFIATVYIYFFILPGAPDFTSFRFQELEERTHLG